MDQLVEEDTCRHLPSFADGYTFNITGNCGCSNTSINMTHATPTDVGHGYFCDINRQKNEGDRETKDNDADDDIWDGKGCGQQQLL